ncbi:MAG: hypothetical protein ACK45A_00235, partial [Planctomyces sp.]
LQNGSSTGNVTLTGNVTVGSLTFGAAAYRVSMTGTSNTITSSVGFVNTGGVTLGDGGDTFTFDGGFTSTASATTLAAAFSTSADNVALGAITLAGNTSFSTAGGSVNATSIDGASALTATLAAGNLTLGATGATTALTGVTIVSAAAVTFQNTVRIAGNLTQSAGTGTTTLNGISGTGISGNLSLTTGSVQFATAPITVGGAVTLAATTINLGNSTGLTATGNITITAGSGGFTQAATAPITTTSSTTAAIALTVNSTGNAVLGRLNADAGTLTVTLGGTGSMTDNNDTPTVGVNLSAKNITLVGPASAIGSGNPLEFLSPNSPTAPTGAGIVNGSSLGGVAGGIARLDFGGNMNYTTTNFTHVPGNKLFTTNGFGFAATALASQAAQSTGYSVSTINLYRDGVTGKGTATSTFRYSIGNGTYSVRIYVGHPTMETSTRVEVEGAAYSGQSGTLAKNVFSTITIGSIQVNDGVLDFVFRAPAGYTGYWLVCGMDIAASIASLPPTAPQRLDGLTFDEGGLEETSTARLASVSRAGRLLTSELVEQARREAVADWITTGLTPGQILALQNATVQITDLNSEGAFGFAGSRMIQLDDDALGFGWHVGSGPVPTGAVDLGTVMRHELGHILGYGDLDPATAGDSIMSGTILPGERRTVSAAAMENPLDSAPHSSHMYALKQNRPDQVFQSESEDEAELAVVSLILTNRTAGQSANHSNVGAGESVQKTKLAGNSRTSPEAIAVTEFTDDLDLQTLDDIFSDTLTAL